MTPPCGVPDDVAVNVPSSTTPDFSQLLICLLTVPFCPILRNNSKWLIRSKHLAISASRTYLAFAFNLVFDLTYRILGASSWSKSITVWLEDSLPFWFKSIF